MGIAEGCSYLPSLIRLHSFTTSETSLMKQVSVTASESGSDGQNCSVYVILFSLTLSLLWYHLKITSNGVQFEMLSFTHLPVNIFT